MLNTKLLTSEGMIEKCEKRLETWQIQFLLMRARLTLVKNVLDNILTYYISLFSMPSKVLKQIDKIIRSFL